MVSQNAKQEAAKDYSYTRYDVLGRITEVGQKHTGTNVLTDPGYLASATITNFQASGNNSQLTETLYDEAAPATGGTPSGLVQNNLRKRVAASIYRETPNSAAINASYYSYDMAGNVKKLYQQVNGLGLKTLDYEYDLVSGKVNLLAYQHDKPDAFYYQYKYDAENRLTEAWSSTQANIVSYGLGSSLNDPTRRLDASYQYYLHGPLARMELGPSLALVQGLDYAYTLQGWLKGVNGTHLDGAQSDIGQDGAVVAKDALGYSLGYYAGDYQPIGGSSATAFASTYQQNLGDITGQNLYNGNIGSSTYAIAKINNGASVGYSYKYDQLNRLKALRQHGLSGTGTWTNSSLSDNYKEDFSYDGNGNILNLLRNGPNGQTMDQLAYRYTKNAAGQLVHNKLGGVNDAVNSGQQGELEGNTGYSYDAIGNLIKDSKEGITNIDWSVYGKIKQINKANSNIVYSYDPSGNRVSKLYNNKTTWYVRDAQGNSLAVYDNANGHYNLKEQQLYGSSRLGMWKPELNIDSAGGASLNSITGNRNYELSNHLGNTMAVISDNRLQTSNGYEADVLHSNDYYAFGAQMPGRMFNLAGSYRYGFNGKENDSEVKGEGNQQDYGMRIYDPRVGRFLSVDPITKQYPELTPYQFASNRPIQGVDLDGLEFKNKSYYEYSVSVKPIPSLNRVAEVVKYINKNRPEYFILMDLYPEPAYTKGYDREVSDRPQLYEYIKPIRPDYSAITAWGQAAQTEMNADEPTMHLSSPRGVGYAPEPVPTKPGAAFGGLGLFMNSYNAISSFLGENAAIAESYYDKTTFYASINLVNNFFKQNKLNVEPKIKGDVVNWVNSGKTPYDLESLKGISSKERKTRLDYNKEIEKLGKIIYDSRRGYNNSGPTSTKPSDKKAIPYR